MRGFIFLEKLTKKEYFTGLIAYFRGEDVEIENEDFIEFCQDQIADLDKKAAKAKERAAAKKAENDELTDLVYSVLTDEYQTIADITVVVAETIADVCASKVTARLTRLCNAGSIEKEQISVEDSEGKKRKCMGYRLAGAPDEADVEE